MQENADLGSRLNVKSTNLAAAQAQAAELQVGMNMHILLHGLSFLAAQSHKGVLDTHPTWEGTVNKHPLLSAKSQLPNSACCTDLCSCRHS